MLAVLHDCVSYSKKCAEDATQVRSVSFCRGSEFSTIFSVALIRRFSAVTTLEELKSKRVRVSFIVVRIWRAELIWMVELEGEGRQRL